MNQPAHPHLNDLTADIIGAAIEVHRVLGPGLLESYYEKCLAHELTLRGHRIARQVRVKVKYKGFEFDDDLRCDLTVNDTVLIELKSVETIHPVHKAQVMSYLKLLNLPVGLLINFNQIKLTDGVVRLSV